MAIKVAMIGAGSVGFARRLAQDILAVPELQDTHFAMMDISRRNLEMVAELCRRDIKANNLPARIDATLDQRRAIADADYVICMIRQGGLDAFALDIDIPLKYGVDQCVGDTLCAGGIMYAQRTIPALLNICRDIRQVGKPNTLLLNYSNPMAMNTRACNQFGQVQTIGLCHGVQGAHWQIAKAIFHWAKKEKMVPADYEGHRREVDVLFAGINHQTWCLKAQWRGIDFIPRLHELMSDVEEFARTEKVRLDVLKRFGYYSTESNGHFSEYVAWYRKNPRRIKNWIDLSCWIHGETGGYLRVCTEGRNWFHNDYPAWLKEQPPKIGPEIRSEEHASYIIEALQTGRIYRGHFNVVNRGHITNLPDGAVVEIPGYVDRTGVHMPVVGDLPLACAATCSSSIHVQHMGVQAAVEGNVTLLKQAMLHDPLCGAVCEPEQIWQMADEMLVAQAKWLPQYRTEIPAARKRLADAQKRGTRVKLLDTRGAARLRIHTVAEMAKSAAQARANASAADKGNMTRSGQRKAVAAKA